MKSDLRTVYVIADSKERENMIREQIKAIEAEQGVQVQSKKDFERSSLNLVELTALWGSFDTKYLMFQKKSWWPQWKRTNGTFVVRVTLMVSSNQTSSPSVMGTLELIKNVIRGNESPGRVLKSGTFGVKTKLKI